MSQDDYIYFAIFALNVKQADEVIHKLKEENMEELSSWLKENKEDIYGEEAEDWRPFKGDTLVDIIRKDSECYQSATYVIKELPKNYEELKKVKNLKVFFVDIFSIYTDNFRDFISKADWDFTESRIKNCCILLNYELPVEGQKHLESKLEEIWKCFRGCYEEGALHRISAREQDVKNFKNYLKIIIPYVKNKPNRETEKVVNDAIGYEGRPLPFV